LLFTIDKLMFGPSFEGTSLMHIQYWTPQFKINHPPVVNS